jgi:subtilisin family serine protease
MKKKFLKQTAALSLSAGLILSSMNFMDTPKVSATSFSAEKILASLTPEQRKALNHLELTNQSGLQGFTKEELTSDTMIDVIVQFRSMPGKIAVLDAEIKGKKLTIKQADEQVAKEHDQFAQDIESILSNENVRSQMSNHQITSSYNTVYNGVVMQLPANQVESLLKSDVVKAVYKNETFKVDPIAFGDENSTTVSACTSVEGISHLKVDQLHQEGFTGKGVKVGVIDTGIDYNHPDLKNAYKGGYDFVDKDSNPMETTYTDWKKTRFPEVSGGNTYYTSHGTHVAGTIAGQSTNKDISVEGVAPGVDLYAYRVLGPYGTGSSINVMAGIEKAVDDGMDIINLSLGAGINDPYYPTSTAVNNAVLSGVITVVAAGNSGPEAYTLGSPGAAALALTVGASDVPTTVSTYYGKIGNENSIDLVSMARNYTDNLKTLDGKSYQVVDVGLGKPTNYNGKDVTGKIALIARGELALVDKISIAKTKGAAAVLLYNDVEGQIGVNLGESTTFIPTFSVTTAGGEKIKVQLTNGQTTLSFSNYGEMQTKGDQLADFSSRGPVRETYGMKPELTAPGVATLSTVPSYIADSKDQENYQFAYARFSGTSMATPFTAGVAALMLQANPKYKPEDIKTVLMNTATPLNGDYSIYEVGAGRINPYNAVHTGASFQIIDKTLIPNAEELAQVKNLTGGLSFNHEMVDKNLMITKSIKVKNNDKAKKTFSVAITEGKDSNSLKQNGMALLISNKIDVKANEEKKVSASLLVHNKAKEGYYTGYIALTNTANKAEQYRIPFNFRLLKEGFNTVEIDNPIFSPIYLNRGEFDFFREPSVISQLNIKAPMGNMDIVLQDENGNDLGLIGTVDLDGAYDNVTYLLDLFYGAYYKFTDDAKKPVSSKESYAPEGHYQVKFIATAASGKVITETRHLWVYINKPQFESTLDGNGPFIEYQEGQKLYPFEFKVTDQIVDEAKKYGVNIDQSSNYLVYYYGPLGFPSRPIYMDQDGKYIDDIQMDDSQDVLSVAFDGYNMGGNKAGKHYYFVKEGTPVTYLSSDAKEVKTGETFTAKLTLDNLNDLSKAEWNFAEDFQQNGLVELVDAKLTDTYADKAEIEVNEDQVSVQFNGSSGELDHQAVVEATFKVLDNRFATYGWINPSVTITDINNQNITVNSATYQFDINPQFSFVEGYVGPEGFLVNDSPSKKDWSKVGGSVKFVNASGNEFDITPYINNFGGFVIEKLPLSLDPYIIEAKIPGHFLTKIDWPISYIHNGTIYGSYSFVSMFSPVAGDVNQDSVIDIMDAIAIQNAWGTNDRAADINFDGKVDAKDMVFVQKNYFLQNEDEPNAPEPKTSYNGKTLITILSELGITP